MERPLTAPGSERLAHDALAQFSSADVEELWERIVAKVRDTVQDGTRHDFLAMSPGGQAMWFVTWPGLHRQVQIGRIGNYLSDVFGMGRVLTDRGVRFTNFLEVDVYVSSDRDAPEETMAIEVEYTHLPGAMLGGRPMTEGQEQIVVLNPDLCTAEERQALSKFMT